LRRPQFEFVTFLAEEEEEESSEEDEIGVDYLMSEEMAQTKSPVRSLLFSHQQQLQYPFYCDTSFISIKIEIAATNDNNSFLSGTKISFPIFDWRHP